MGQHSDHIAALKDRLVMLLNERAEVEQELEEIETDILSLKGMITALEADNEADSNAAG